MIIFCNGAKYTPTLSYTDGKGYMLEDGENIGTGDTLDGAVHRFLRFIKDHQPKRRLSEGVLAATSEALIEKVQYMELPEEPAYIRVSPFNGALTMEWTNGVRVTFHESFEEPRINGVADVVWLKRLLDAIRD